MNAVNLKANVPEPALPDPGRSRDPARIRDAAQQFEALLLGQILRSARENGGWLGSGSDSSADCATSFAEQHLSAMLAQQGGFGLTEVITHGLEKGR